MVESDSVRERLLESRILDPIEMRLKVLLLDVEESLPFLVREAVGEDVVRSKLALFPRRDEGDDGFLASPVVDGEVGGFGHSEHEGREVRDVVALDVDVHGERSSARDEDKKENKSISSRSRIKAKRKEKKCSPGSEVEHVLSRSSEPVSEISSVRERDTASDDPRRVSGLRRDESSSRDENLVGWSNGSSDELKLVGDEESDLGDGLPDVELPSPREVVPLFERRREEKEESA